MTKLSVVVATSCIAVTTIWSGQALSAPRYPRRSAFGLGVQAEERYFGRRNVGYLGEIPFGPRRAAPAAPFVNGSGGDLRPVGGNVLAYSVAPSFGAGLRYLGGSTWAYSGPPAYGVLSLPTGTAFGYPSPSPHAVDFGGTFYLDPRDPYAWRRHFSRGR